MSIKDWPDSARPREKLFVEGAAKLSDAELLAVVLRNGTPGRDAVALAHDALTSHGGLRRLVEASPKCFLATPGFGRAAYCTLAAALEIARRCLYDTLERGGPLESPDAAGAYLRARMTAYRREVFACLYLDARHRVIAFRELFFGSIDSASVHPREIVRAALELNAAAVILAHNHPSGVAEPSSADTAITRRIVTAAELVEVRVLDHLVVGDGEVVSMAARGLL